MAVVVGEIVTKFVADMEGLVRKIDDLTRNLDRLSTKKVAMKVEFDDSRVTTALLRMDKNINKLAGLVYKTQDKVAKTVNANVGFIEKKVLGANTKIGQKVRETGKSIQSVTVKTSTTVLGFLENVVKTALKVSTILTLTGMVTLRGFVDAMISTKGVVVSLLSLINVNLLSLQLSAYKLTRLARSSNSTFLPVLEQIGSWLHKIRVHVLGLMQSTTEVSTAAIGAVTKVNDKIEAVPGNLTVIGAGVLGIGEIVSTVADGISAVLDVLFSRLFANLKDGWVALWDLNDAMLTTTQRLTALTTFSMTILGMGSVVRVAINLFKSFMLKRPDSVLGRLAALINTIFLGVFNLIPPMTILVNRIAAFVSLGGAAATIIAGFVGGISTLGLSMGVAVAVVSGAIPLMQNFISAARVGFYRVMAMFGSGKAQMVLFIKAVRESFDTIAKFGKSLRRLPKGFDLVKTAFAFASVVEGIHNQLKNIVQVLFSSLGITMLMDQVGHDIEGTVTRVGGLAKTQLQEIHGYLENFGNVAAKLGGVLFKTFKYVVFLIPNFLGNVLRGVIAPILIAPIAGLGLAIKKLFMLTVGYPLQRWFMNFWENTKFGQGAKKTFGLVGKFAASFFLVLFGRTKNFGANWKKIWSPGLVENLTKKVIGLKQTEKSITQNLTERVLLRRKERDDLRQQLVLLNEGEELTDKVLVSTINRVKAHVVAIEQLKKQWLEVGATILRAGRWIMLLPVDMLINISTGVGKLIGGLVLLVYLGFKKLGGLIVKGLAGFSKWFSQTKVAKFFTWIGSGIATLSKKVFDIVRVTLVEAKNQIKGTFTWIGSGIATLSKKVFDIVRVTLVEAKNQIKGTFTWIGSGIKKVWSTIQAPLGKFFGWVGSGISKVLGGLFKTRVGGQITAPKTTVAPEKETIKYLDQQKGIQQQLIEQEQKIKGLVASTVVESRKRLDALVTGLVTDKNAVISENDKVLAIKLVLEKKQQILKAEEELVRITKQRSFVEGNIAKDMARAMHDVVISGAARASVLQKSQQIQESYLTAIQNEKDAYNKYVAARISGDSKATKAALEEFKKAQDARGQAQTTYQKRLEELQSKQAATSKFSSAQAIRQDKERMDALDERYKKHQKAMSDNRETEKEIKALNKQVDAASKLVTKLNEGIQNKEEALKLAQKTGRAAIGAVEKEKQKLQVMHQEKAAVEKLQANAAKELELKKKVIQARLDGIDKAERADQRATQSQLHRAKDAQNETYKDLVKLKEEGFKIERQGHKPIDAERQQVIREIAKRAHETTDAVGRRIYNQTEHVRQGVQKALKSLGVDAHAVITDVEQKAKDAAKRVAEDARVKYDPVVAGVRALMSGTKFVPKQGLASGLLESGGLLSAGKGGGIGAAFNQKALAIAEGDLRRYLEIFKSAPNIFGLSEKSMRTFTDSLARLSRETQSTGVDTFKTKLEEFYQFGRSLPTKMEEIFKDMSRTVDAGIVKSLERMTSTQATVREYFNELNQIMIKKGTVPAEKIISVASKKFGKQFMNAGEEAKKIFVGISEDILAEAKAYGEPGSDTKKGPKHVTWTKKIIAQVGAVLKGGMVGFRAGGERVTRQIGDGVEKGKSRIGRAMTSVMGFIKKFLPASPPELGPLAGNFLGQSGGKIVDMLTLGILKHIPILGKLLKAAIRAAITVTLFPIFGPTGLLIFGVRKALGLLKMIPNAFRSIAQSVPVTMLRETAKAIHEIGLAAARLVGVENVGAYDRFGKAVEYLGVQSSQLETIFMTMNRRLDEARSGNEEAAESFIRFGVNLQDTGLTGIEVFKQIAERIKELREINAVTDAEVNEMATHLGVSYGALAGLLTAGGEALEEFEERAERMGSILDPEQLERAKKFVHLVQDVKITLDGIKREVVDNALPYITAWFEKAMAWWVRYKNVAYTILKGIAAVIQVVINTLVKRIKQYISGEKSIFDDAMILFRELIIAMGRFSVVFFENLIPVLKTFVTTIWTLIRPLFTLIGRYVADVWWPKMRVDVFNGIRALFEGALTLASDILFPGFKAAWHTAMVALGVEEDKAKEVKTVRYNAPEIAQLLGEDYYQSHLGEGTVTSTEGGLVIKATREQQLQVQLGILSQIGEELAKINQIAEDGNTLTEDQIQRYEDLLKLGKEVSAVAQKTQADMERAPLTLPEFSVGAQVTNDAMRAQLNARKLEEAVWDARQEAMASQLEQLEQLGSEYGMLQDRKEELDRIATEFTTTVAQMPQFVEERGEVTSRFLEIEERMNRLSVQASALAAEAEAAVRLQFAEETAEEQVKIDEERRRASLTDEQRFAEDMRKLFEESDFGGAFSTALQDTLTALGTAADDIYGVFQGTIHDLVTNLGLTEDWAELVRVVNETLAETERQIAEITAAGGEVPQALQEFQGAVQNGVKALQKLRQEYQQFMDMIERKTETVKFDIIKKIFGEGAAVAHQTRIEMNEELRKMRQELEARQRDLTNARSQAYTIGSPEDQNRLIDLEAETKQIERLIDLYEDSIPGAAQKAADAAAKATEDQVTSTEQTLYDMQVAAYERMGEAVPEELRAVGLQREMAAALQDVSEGYDALIEVKMREIERINAGLAEGGTGRVLELEAEIEELKAMLAEQLGLTADSFGKAAEDIEKEIHENLKFAGSTVADAIGTTFGDRIKKSFDDFASTGVFTDPFENIIGDIFAEMGDQLIDNLVTKVTEEMGNSLTIMFKEVFAFAGEEIGGILAQVSMVILSLLLRTAEEVETTKDAIEELVEETEEVRGIISGETTVKLKEVADNLREALVPTNDILIDILGAVRQSNKTGNNLQLSAAGASAR